MPVLRNRYVVVSPAKDEERYVETTIKAMLAQTVPPARWVIVDDGSCDGTPSILESYAKKVDWITVLTLPRVAGRHPGSGVIRAFLQGYQLIRDEQFDFIVKLDCDLDFAPNYFEELIARFGADPNLGIASGVYLEKHKGKWVSIRMPAYHAAGASKVVRVRCFQEIGGFLPFRGWDAIDQIKAQMSGWRTCHFPDLKLYHLRNEGSGIGSLRTHYKSGEIHYVTGGGKLFFLLKFLHRLFFGSPLVLGGLVMLVGYLKNCVCRSRRRVTDSEVRFYRELLNRRITEALRRGVEWIRLMNRRAWRYN